MSKTSTDLDLARHSLNGATMGTRWSVTFHAPPGTDLATLQAEFQTAVDRVDDQMSTWKPHSDLMRFNAAPVGAWHPLPAELQEVLGCALEIGRASGGAFEIGMGDAVRAWGFGPAPADETAIRAALHRPRRPSYEVLDLDPTQRRARKTAPITLDLCGIAKGYGVDCLIAVAKRHGIAHALASIDGELRALGPRPDGQGWAVALEKPQIGHRDMQAMFEIQDIALATSGDYRHFVKIGPHHLAHTMDPATGAPLRGGPASVTVLAETCMRADAIASAVMVLGETRGTKLAAALGAEVVALEERLSA
ncbi:thiamine biosynthesis protein ApbE [Rhodobacter sp. TJ_12]|uniref:FAD:protein FMN transferase n=1 Tax=Rhodobacter sp. TJ_12 TaxID=2029399 RepID=UPI001CBDBD67|nr:FAD:protein FMN transferase [Rhodobacter sp. TJ_12]MBZ4023319.1 thiamine biosynthesis protein ApbE [Rhodobacter sp. TJ_12]